MMSGMATTFTRMDESTAEQWAVIGRENVYFGYTFDYGWEIAEGIWTKQILYNGKVIAEKKFKIIVPLN